MKRFAKDDIVVCEGTGGGWMMGWREGRLGEAMVIFLVDKASFLFNEVTGLDCLLALPHVCHYLSSF